MKRILLSTGAVLLLAPALLKAAGQPNILVIVADDLGYGETGFQGCTKDIPTPNLDALAADGIRFTSGYVSGPYCSPTRAALLTGRYQQRYGHEFNGGREAGLSLDETTIGDRLRAAGYKTDWFGKSHQGFLPEYHPLKRGFDEYYGFLGAAHSYLRAGDGDNAILRGTDPVAEVGYTTDAFAHEAADFIERHKDGPWFTYLAFNAVHSPLEATEKYLGRFGGIPDEKRRKFAAMLSALDDGVGTVLAKLRELGLEENTLIFFLSDNGGPTGETTSGNGPLRGFKAQTWEGGVRVPFFVRWKGRLPAGKVDDRPVIQLDILPTALAAAGVKPAADWKPLDGVNLLPYLSGENTGAPHEVLYWRFGPQLAVRKGDWKLVKAPQGGGIEEVNPRESASLEGAQLYNLAQDIGERTNLAAQEPEKVRELAELWEAWNKELVPPSWYPEPRKRAAVSNASPQGPWKAGDHLAGADAPQVAGRALSISADVEPASPDGVIVAQGGSRHGYALYLQDGRLALAVRAAGELATATSSESLSAGKHSVQADLAADGRVTLWIDGKTAGEGRAPGLLPEQPAEGLGVGEDDASAVGEYEAPFAFKGKVENVRVALP